MSLDQTPPTPSQGASMSLDDMVESWATIKKDAFVVTMGVFFALAMLSVLARVIIRLRTWRRLGLDDYFLFVAALFLAAATGLQYKLIDDFYLLSAVQQDPSIVYELGSGRLQDINTTAAKTIALIVLCWTASFAVKMSFLAFFRQLVSNIEGIQWYYWIVVVYAAVTWAFVIGEAFISCPYFGAESVKCLEPARNVLFVSLAGLVTGLDCLSDVLIVSLPIIILRRANMKLRQKITLGAFLSLSLVMALMSITRVSRVKGAHGVDIPWEFFWLFMESSVAVIMGSLTAFRTLFIAGNLQRRRRAEEDNAKRWRTNTFLRMRERRKGAEGGQEGNGNGNGLPQIPRGTMTGLRTFIRRNHRTAALATTSVSMTALSRLDTLDEHGDAYHMVERRPETKVQVGFPQQSPTTTRSEITTDTGMYTTTTPTT